MGKRLLLLLPTAALLCGACYTQLGHPLLTQGTRIETVSPGADCRACHDEALFHDDLRHRWWLSFGDLPEGAPWVPAWERRAHQPWWQEGGAVVRTADGSTAPRPADPPEDAGWSGSVGSGVASGRQTPPPRAVDEGEPPPSGPPAPARPAVKNPRQRPAAADSSKAGEEPGRDS